MARVFISYARATAATAEHVAKALTDLGHNVWYDAALLGHRSFADSIEEELRAADAVLVLWSADGVRSEWVRSEANRGREERKLVQVRLDGCLLPMPFDQIHCIDLSNWIGSIDTPAWQSVNASINAVLQRPGAAGPRLAAHSSIAPSQPSHAGLRSASAAASVPSTVGPERRQVTSLAAELAGLSTELDPEDLLAICESFQASADDCIGQYGGVIARRTEQGLLAHFGYPQTDEEEAANAVRAALAMRDGIAGARAPDGTALAVRAGIATGMVVVGERGLVGDPLTLAADLAAAARAGDILLATATRRITEGMFDLADRDPVQGSRGREPAVSALGATQVASRSHARAGRAGGTSMLGRQAELDQILACWQSAASGQGQTVLVQGEPGMGKSTLVDAARRRILEAGGREVSLVCGPAISTRPLQPILDQLVRAAGFHPHDAAEAKLDKLVALLVTASAEAIAVIADALGIAGPQLVPLPQAPEGRRSLLFNSLLVYLVARAAHGPVLILVEDAHWGDPTTIELLDRAVQMAIDQPWLILATARPEFAGGWEDHSDFAHIRLERLEAADARRIAEAAPGAADLPANVLAAIVARADGNPLYLEEVTRSVLDAFKAGGSAADLAVPATLQDSLIARLDQLGGARRIATAGAAIGRQFGYDLLSRILSDGAAELRQALRDLAKAGILDASGLPPTSRYSFRHALMRDAAYDLLPKRQREQLHGSIADALLVIDADIAQADPALLADHLARGGRGGEALPLWIAAGQQAAGRAAHAEAAGHLQKALSQVRAGPADMRDVGMELQLLIGLAVSLAATRGYSHPDVGAVLTDARGICDALGNVEGLFAVLRGLCAFSIVAGDMATAEDLARRCLAIGESSGVPIQRIEGHCPLGYVLWACGRLPEARHHLETAISLYDVAGRETLPLITPQDPLVQCLGPLQVLHHAMGNDDEADAAAARLARHREVLGESFSAAAALFWKSYGSLARGRLADAGSEAQAAVALCERDGFLAFIAVADLIGLYVEGAHGDPAAVLPRVRRRAASAGLMGKAHTAGFHIGQIAVLERAAGDAAAALALVDRGIGIAETLGERIWLAPLQLLRAELLMSLPEPDAVAAAAAVATALDIAQLQGATRYAAEARALAACIAA